MLEESLVGQTDEQTRFARRGISQENLFLDLSHTSRRNLSELRREGGEWCGARVEKGSGGTNKLPIRHVCLVSAVQIEGVTVFQTRRTGALCWRTEEVPGLVRDGAEGDVGRPKRYDCLADRKRPIASELSVFGSLGSCRLGLDGEEAK